MTTLTGFPPDILAGLVSVCARWRLAGDRDGDAAPLVTLYHHAAGLGVNGVVPASKKLTRAARIRSRAVARKEPGSCQSAIA